MSEAPDSPAKKTALRAIAGLRDQAKAPPPVDDHDDGAGDDDGGGDGRLHTGEKRLPEGCPVTPLGINGDMYFLLDATGQFREVKDERFTRLKIASLFGSYAELLEEYWPRMTQNKGEWVVTGWKPEQAAMALTSACADIGVWSPFAMLRGRGAWLGREGELILHCGDKVMIGPPPASRNQRPQWVKPGKIDGFVYPTAAPTQRPADKQQPCGGEAGSPGDELLAILRSWNWRGGEVDALRLLGLIGAQMVGGAIKFRPPAWMTGGFGTGKSAAQDLVKWLHGTTGIISVADATSAGIWQKLKYDSLSVGLDEQEAEEDNRKNFALVKLARAAATGSMVLRGGADHQGAEFMARSCFLFSSILIPPMLGQDRSRIVVLELNKLKTVSEFKPTEKAMNKLGARILRRMVDGWHRWQETFEIYRQALGECGHSGRGADVMGTVLTASDLILFDAVPDAETAKDMAGKLAAPMLADMEHQDSDEIACWQHLLSTVIDPYRSGGRKSIAEWISRARGLAKDNDGNFVSGTPVNEANQVLQTFGLRIVGNAEIVKLYGVRTLRDLPEGIAPPYLAVANSHPSVAQIFAGTHWGSRSGAQGVWVQALRRLEGATVPHKPLWLSGDDSNSIRSASHRVTLIPLDAASGQGDGTSPGTAAQQLGPLGAAAREAEAAASAARGDDAGTAQHTDDGGDYGLEL